MSERNVNVANVCLAQGAIAAEIVHRATQGTYDKARDILIVDGHDLRVRIEAALVSAEKQGISVHLSEIGRRGGKVGGKIGGKATTKRKQDASRHNGHKGGRPKKAIDNASDSR